MNFFSFDASTAGSLYGVLGPRIGLHRRSFIDMVYDVSLRGRLGANRAHRRYVTRAWARFLVDAMAVSGGIQSHGESSGIGRAELFESLIGRIDRYFDAAYFLEPVESAVGLGPTIRGDLLPFAIRKPGRWFSTEWENRHAIALTADLLQWESERRYLTSHDVLGRFQSDSAAFARGATYFSLLNETEKNEVRSAVQNIRQFSGKGVDMDVLHDLPTYDKQVEARLKMLVGFLPVVGSSAGLGEAIHLGDAEEGTLNAAALMGDIFSGGGSRILRIGSAVISGAGEAWELKRAVDALKRAVTTGKRDDVSAAVFGVVLGAYGSLDRGMGMARSLAKGALARGSDARAMKDVKSTIDGANPHAVPAGRANAVPGASRSQLWSIESDGRVVSGKAGSKVVDVDAKGNLLLASGVRAVYVPQPRDGIYLLGGRPHVLSGRELRSLEAQLLREDAWSVQNSESGRSVVEYRAETGPFPQRFSVATADPVELRDGMIWFEHRRIDMEHLQDVAQDAEAGRTIGIGAIEHKYVIERGGSLQVLDHRGVDDGRTSLVATDGSSYQVDRALPEVPVYKQKLTARIVGGKGMFVVVELDDPVEGLSGRSQVSGVLLFCNPEGGKAQAGAQEVVLDADVGVYYAGSIQADQAIDYTSTAVEGRAAVEVVLTRIDSGDPKRASPAMWREDARYRNGIAHNDFRLEALIGSQQAHYHVAHFPDWMARKQDFIRLLREDLPGAFSDHHNPYYLLSIPIELSILFAPRYAHALPGMLVGKEFVSGQVSEAPDVRMVEHVFKRLTLDGSPLLSVERSLPATAALKQAYFERLRRRDLAAGFELAEVVDSQGKKHWLVDRGDLDERLCLATDSDPDVHLVSGGLIDELEARFPFPDTLAGIRVLTLGRVGNVLAARVMRSSRRGYPFHSLISLENPEAAVRSVQNEHGATSAGSLTERPDPVEGIAPVSIEVSDSQLIREGAKEGAFQVGSGYVIRLEDDGLLYNAHWDEDRGCFMLIPPEGIDSSKELHHPEVRKDGHGRFFLATHATPTEIRLGSGDSYVALPDTFEFKVIDGQEVVVASDPRLVTPDYDEAGGRIIHVRDATYVRSEREGGSVVYERSREKDAMEIVCLGRSRRGVNEMVCAADGLAIRSRDAILHGLPSEDDPGAVAPVSWGSDLTIDATKGVGAYPNYALVPSERSYFRLGGNRLQPLTQRERQEMALPKVPEYRAELDATLLRRKGYSAHLDVRQIEQHLVSSRATVPASIFPRKGGGDLLTEDMVVQVDGNWWFGVFRRTKSAGTPKTIKLHRKTEFDEFERAAMEHHAAMQSANYFRKVKGADSFGELLAHSRSAGLFADSSVRHGTHDLVKSPESTYVFSRRVRGEVQVKQKDAAGWPWIRVTEQTSPEVRTRVEAFELLAINLLRRIFLVRGDIRDLRGGKQWARQHALEDMSLGSKKNYLLAVEGNQVYVAISGRVQQDRTFPFAATPGLFRRQSGGVGASAHCMIDGVNYELTFINALPELPGYLERLNRDPDYPPALPRVATAEQLAAPLREFHLAQPHDWDTERLLAAYLFGKARSERAELSFEALHVYNRNDACSSCTAGLVKLFGRAQEVIHVFGKPYAA